MVVAHGCVGSQIRTGLLAVLMLSSLSAQGQGLGQRPVLEEMVVTASQQGSLTSLTDSEARAELERVPGGIGFVPADSYLDQFAQSIGDTLVFTPGVFADTSALRENRLSIRGSGLNAGFERRGVTLLRDGVPITRASGSTEFQEVDPLSIRYIEVYKGANGLRYGAAAMGGAINIVTPTGISRSNEEKPNTLRIEGGRFNTLRANVTLADHAGDYDYYASLTDLQSDGFRDNNAVDSGYGFANLGIRLTEQIETRFYLTLLNDRFELAAALSEQDALRNPEKAGDPVVVGPIVLDPGPVADRWDRNLEVRRFSNKTAISLPDGQLEFGAWLSQRDLDHAITRFAGIIDQREDEQGLFVRYQGNAAALLAVSRWTVGLELNRADNDARRWQNLDGYRGDLRSRSDQLANNGVLYGELEWTLNTDLTLLLGGQFVHLERESRGVLNEVTDRLNDHQFNPKLGLLWAIADQAQIYANLSRSFEPPSLADLTAGGALSWTPLQSQRAWTLEAGTRGQHAAWAWDVSLYRSEIDNEFIDVVDNSGFNTVSVTENADAETLHQGFELGLDYFVPAAMLQRAGLGLVWRNAFTWQDFRFDGSPVYGSNQLPAVPERILVSSLRLDGENWYAGINLRHIADGPYVDYANSKRVDGYTLTGLTAGWSPMPVLTFFLSVENVTNKRYIANVATVADFQQESGRIFTPGQGRAAFGGFIWRF